MRNRTLAEEYEVALANVREYNRSLRRRNIELEDRLQRRWADLVASEAASAARERYLATREAEWNENDWYRTYAQLQGRLAQSVEQIAVLEAELESGRAELRLARSVVAR